MLSLHLRLNLLLILFFGIIYCIITVFSSAMGMQNFSFYIVLAFGFMIIQYMIGPKIVEWIMKVRYITKSQNPWLYQTVKDLSRKAKIPVPRIGISQTHMQ